MSKYSFICSLIILALTGIESSPAGDAPVTNKPEYKVGDYWVLDGKFNTVDCDRWEVVEINNAEGMFIEQCEDYKIYHSYENNYDTVKITKGNSKTVVEYDPPFQALKFPLKVGKTWEQEYSGYTADNNARWESKVEFEIESYEQIEVAAGTFNAYKINWQDSWRAGQYNGTNNVTGWWSPEVGMFVRMKHPDPRFDFELTDYRLQ